MPPPRRAWMRLETAYMPAVAMALLAACAGPKESAAPKQAPPPSSAPKPSSPPAARSAGFADLYWPPARPFLNSPVVSVSPSGERTVKQFQFPRDVWSAFEAAERAYRATDCVEAERRYREVLEACPACYPALIGLGDCELIQGKARDAVDHYREAEQLNPDDFLGYFSEADAIGRMGNLGEARELLTRALVLRPRRETVLKAFHLNADRMGAIVDDEPLRPRAAFVGENELVVDLAKDDPARLWWMVYAICKHATSPGQPKLEGKPPPLRWNVTTEEACLRKTAGMYAEKRTAKGADPALERFLAADAAGLAKGFVLYEIAARLDPQIVLEVMPQDRKLVDRYVRTIVVRDRER